MDSTTNLNLTASGDLNSCGNGICQQEMGENCAVCPSDCGCSSGYECVNMECKIISTGGNTGGGGGGGGTTTTTTIISFTKDGVNVSLGLNSIAKFAFDRAYHTIKVIKIGTDYITLEIASDPVTITLKLLGSRKLDLNNDNYYDLYVKLNEIKSSKAYLEVKYIHEIIKPVVPAVEEEGDTKITTPPKIGVPNESIIIPSTENDSINKSAGNETGEGKKITYNYLFYLGIIIITVIIIILYIKKWKK